MGDRQFFEAFIIKYIFSLFHTLFQRPIVNSFSFSEYGLFFIKIVHQLSNLMKSLLYLIKKLLNLIKKFNLQLENYKN